MEPSTLNVSVDFLADLTIALSAAMILGLVAERLRISAIVGYLVAGILIGRFTPGYVANVQNVQTLAQLGLIFLLFSIGLGFSFDEVKSLGARAIGGNLVVMVAATAAGGVACMSLAFQHPWTGAIATCVSSTAVAVALLRSWDIESSGPGRFTIAQQIVQDLVAVALLVVVTAPPAELSVFGILVPLIKAALFVAIALVLGATVLHTFVRRTVLHASTDVLFGIFSALALVAAWLGYIAGLSFEFGAFVAGAVISEAAGSAVIASVVAPFRSLFVTLFFVSVGMSIDLSFFASHWIEIVAAGFALAAIRCALWFVLARFDAMTAAGAVFVGVGMASLGEFNVVLITEAQHASRLSGSEAQILLGVTIVTMVACVVPGPWLSRLRTSPMSERVRPEGESRADARVALIGFGRVGQTVASVLGRAHIPYVAIERDAELVREMRREGHAVILGDALDPAAFDRIFTGTIEVFIITVPESTVADILAQRAKARTGARVVARARDSSDVDELYANGASVVLVPEVEGALSFAEAALRALQVSNDTTEHVLSEARHGDH